MGIKFGANNSEGSNRGSRMSLDEYMKEINSMKEKDKNKKSSSSNNDENMVLEKEVVEVFGKDNS